MRLNRGQGHRSVALESYGIKTVVAAVCSRMTPPSAAPPVANTTTPARAYERAHAGKLMIIQRKEGQEPATADFFQFDAVGTHPTGLIVTGVFQDSHRAHMMAAGVREASAAEIAWLTTANQTTPLR